MKDVEQGRGIKKKYASKKNIKKMWAHQKNIFLRIKKKVGASKKK